MASLRSRCLGCWHESALIDFTKLVRYYAAQHHFGPRHWGSPDRPAALVTTAAVPPWAWALVGLVVGIPFCAQLNCYIEKKREECAKRDEVDANV